MHERQLQVDQGSGDERVVTTIPIEDIGIVILDNPQITLSQALIKALGGNNSVIISCDDHHLPLGIMLPMYAHNTFTEKMRYQVESSLPLKKNLWQQTVVAKINNQARLLEMSGMEVQQMDYWKKQVRSGDPDNFEARAAAFYWERLFSDLGPFRRHRFGGPPNNLLNYGYAILRAVVARSLVASGLIPSIAIHHRNKYNPFCLADDIMEPYRPFVDMKVLHILSQYEEIDELTRDIKKELLSIPVMDIVIDRKSSPLLVGVQRTTASLASCFEGKSKKLLFPELKFSS
jgi:CRISPR-associated protein Cas1